MRVRFLGLIMITFLGTSCLHAAMESAQDLPGWIADIPNISYILHPFQRVPAQIEALRATKDGLRAMEAPAGPAQDILEWNDISNQASEAQSILDHLSSDIGEDDPTDIRFHQALDNATQAYNLDPQDKTEFFREFQKHKDQTKALVTEALEPGTLTNEERDALSLQQLLSHHQQQLDRLVSAVFANSDHAP